MTIENNSNEAVNTAIETVAMETVAPKTYQINIASQEKGHETLELELEEATDSIINNASGNARWVFINNAKFEFEGTNYNSPSNRQRLQTQLQAVENPVVMLTGKLIGGNGN
jgi:hypothetical protein